MTDQVTNRSYEAYDFEDEFRLQAWAEEARELLLDIAEAGETINYKALWDFLLETSEVEAPRGLWRDRTGALCYRVAQLNRANEEPLLTSLVVLKRSGEVDKGYQDGVALRYGYLPSNIAAHARVERRKIARWLKV